MMFSEKRTSPPNTRKEAINNKSTGTIVIVATAAGENKAHYPHLRGQYSQVPRQLGARKTRISAKTESKKGKLQGSITSRRLAAAQKPALVSHARQDSLKILKKRNAKMSKFAIAA